MAKGNNQKLKLLYLAKIFMEMTDEEHGLTVQEIISLLKQSEVNADRKTLYSDFEELRHGGTWYHISPWALVWDDEYYYLIGYDADAASIKHYRVDKMLHLDMTEEKREGKDVFKKLDLARYSKGLFGMFGGEEISVTLLCENNMADAIIDRFGKDIVIVREDEGHFKTIVTVSASNQFLGWIFALGKGVKITTPESMVEAMREEARRLAEQYLEE